MDRDEEVRERTLARFLLCEGERREARDAALKAGKSEGEAWELGQKAARVHWNAWAENMLATRKALEQLGQWDAEQSSWKEKAEVNFSWCLFLSKGGRGGEAPEEGEDIHQADTPPVVVDAALTDMRAFVFPGKVSFEGSSFQGVALFDNTDFHGDTSFASATFQSNTSFSNATFEADTSFGGASFQGYALFESARFQRCAWFDSASFKSEALFSRVTFEGDARFASAHFQGEASFGSSSFQSDAGFNSAKFHSDASFGSARFLGNVRFGSASFHGYARFDGADFQGNSWFASARFQGDTSFRALTFRKDAFFEKAKFGPGYADFGLATFERVATFDKAEFKGEADFDAVWGKRTFNMAGARFERVPDFIQAHFDEAPRLDDVYVEPPQGLECLTEAEAKNLFSRWRALKRLAIQAHDTDRELEFNAQEIRAERAASGWPIPNKAHGWKIWLRSFFGWLYGFFSNYGRSLVRPLAAWAIGILAFAAFYLSQTEVLQRDLSLQDSWTISATVRAGGYALLNTVPCYPPPLTPAENWRKRWRWRGTPLPDPNATHVDGLSEKVRNQTNARAEALHLAFRNAFVMLDGGSDASHRMYGCLYGLELYAGQNPVPIVPSAVSTASAIQKLISGVLIFLFGLALRNMLKVK